MAAKNKITDLRDHLFETLEALRDDEKPMEIARAKAVADVAKAIIESAKVEVAFLKTTGGVSGTGFIPELQDAPVAPMNRRLPKNADPIERQFLGTREDRRGRNGSTS